MKSQVLPVVHDLPEEIKATHWKLRQAPVKGHYELTLTGKFLRMERNKLKSNDALGRWHA